jgi:hypothetical protein
LLFVRFHHTSFEKQKFAETRLSAATTIPFLPDDEKWYQMLLGMAVMKYDATGQ